MALQKELVPARIAPLVGRVRGLRASRLGPGSRVYEELVTRSKEYDWFREDFGKTLAGSTGTDEWLQWAESGASFVQTKLTPTAAHPSYLSLASGATDDINGNLTTVAMYLARNNPFIEMKFQVDTNAANATFETAFGFGTAIPGSAASLLGDIDTPTFAGGVTDAAVIGIDTDQTLKTTAAVTIGTTTAAAKTNIAPTTAPYGEPTVDVDVIYRVELRGKGTDADPSVAYFWINDQLMAVSAAGPDDEKILTGIAQFGVRSTTEVIWKVDYIEAGQQKLGVPFFS